MSNETKIKCPKCYTEIDVNAIIYKQIQSETESNLHEEINKQKIEIAIEKEKIIAREKELESKRQKSNELFQEKINKEKSIIELEIKKKFEKENADAFAKMQKELFEKSEQVKELNISKAEIEKLKREKEEVKYIADAEAEKKLNEKLNIELEKARKQEKEKNELEKKELLKQIEDQKKLTEEMARKQNQGSMQLQGEVQELAIEEYLKTNFPLDTIIEIGKGAKGADCRQIINTRNKENCGSIYYESKRTKEFSKTWIEKFKNDIREQNASIGILVSDVMPAGMDRFGLREGVWICSYEEFKGLCYVIRENIISIDLAISTQENKGDKMVMLYDYLTSNEFKLQVEGIIEGYTQMQADLESEKRSIMGNWKKREKQLQKVLNNTNFMYNSLRGIAGNAIQKINILELPEQPNILELDEPN